MIGGNNPPNLIDHSKSVIEDINKWLADHPTIETEDDAREAKPYLDRAKLALDEMESERDSKVRPLNEQVAEINTKYKCLHSTDTKKPGLFDKIVNELKSRISAYLAKEEQRREQEAEIARKAKEEAGRIAREAECIEKEALENARSGEVIDVAHVTQQADEAFGEFEMASRFSDLADRNTKVKIGGGFAKSASLRTIETLHLDSYGKALKAIGPHEKIKETILSAAREYRKTHGHLPDGVTATTERKL